MSEPISETIGETIRLRAGIVIAVCIFASLVVLADVAMAASDPVAKCRQTVVRGAAKLAVARLASLRKCEEAKRVGKLPVPTACGDEAGVRAALATATSKLATALDRACGGPDKRCGGSDDVDLAAMQWPSTCPELEGSGCATPLASCADIPGCLACLADAAVTRGVDLVYTPLVYAPFPLADAATQKAVVRCQKALTTAATALAATRIAVDARCLAARLAGKHDRSCPLPGDGKAAAVLAKAHAKAEAGVCKACGGADKQCGGGDDLGRELVGVASACPGVGACSTRIESLVDLVACFGCTAAVRDDCVLAAAAPGVAEYPPSCAVVPPTPSATPTPTLTASATPTFTPSPTPTATPIFCPAASPFVATTSVTITIATGGPALGGASLRLAYPPERVRMRGVGDDPAVSDAITDLTSGALFAKGAPNNQDSDGDLEPDRLRFTLVSTAGVNGAILRVVFDRCAGMALTVAGDYVCTVDGAVATDGKTALPGTVCTVDVTHAP